MTTRRKTKFIQVNGYAAEVEVEVQNDGAGWAPYLTVQDAMKLDEVRNALSVGDLKKASAMARIFELKPIN